MRPFTHLNSALIPSISSDLAQNVALSILEIHSPERRKGTALGRPEKLAPFLAKQ
jgi:hypothetical protein